VELFENLVQNLIAEGIPDEIATRTADGAVEEENRRLLAAICGDRKLAFHPKLPKFAENYFWVLLIWETIKAKIQKEEHAKLEKTRRNLQEKYLTISDQTLAQPTDPILLIN